MNFALKRNLKMNDLAAVSLLGDLDWRLELFFVVTLTLLIRFVSMRFLNGAAKRLEKTANIWDDALLDAAKRPLSWLILVFGLLWAVGLIDDYVDTGFFSTENLAVVRQISLIGLVAWFLIRLIDRAELRIRQTLLSSENSVQSKIDPTTLMALAKLVRLSVIISAALILMPTLGIEVTALLAFGGVGGIAVGFAAQDLLSNFFGGLMIYLDRPFAIGDWIRSPDRDIEGTVESIGWRLTVVRTFDKRPLYIPNSIFNTLALENPSRMLNRRIKETIGLRYQDASKIDDIVMAVRNMLETHEEIDQSQTLMVNLNSYAPSSLDFFIYTFTKTTNWVRYHEIKQDVMIKIINIVHDHDADFAFPTRTINGFPNEFKNS
jgi:MscS family membrane protein